MDLSKRLQVGIDFSRAKVDLCLLHPGGEVLVMHKSFSNSPAGYQKAKELLQKVLDSSGLEQVDISGEATGFYWLPFYLQLANDPELKALDEQLFVLNPLWVRWFKKSLPQDDKTDAKDPFYIADRTRTRRPKEAWSPQENWMGLRFYTRIRFHLAQDLVREKNFFQAYLFLAHTGYHRVHPFTDTFSVTSRKLLLQPLKLAELVEMPEEQIAAELFRLSGHSLRDPLPHARLLKQAMQESFSLPIGLSEPIQRILDLVMRHIEFLEGQIQQVEQWIAADALAHHPEVQLLSSIPGIGPVFASGIAAEVGDLERFLSGRKWDPKRQAYRLKRLRDAEDAIAKFAGLWWPRSSSGDFEAEERSLAKTGNAYLRYYLIEAADSLRRHIPSFAAYYQKKFPEVNKHKHKRALVLTARMSLGLYVGLLHRHEAYRPEVA
jgi:transposase